MTGPLLSLISSIIFNNCFSDLTKTQLCSMGLKFLKCAFADLETVLTVSPVESEIMCTCIFLFFLLILLAFNIIYKVIQIL